MKKLVLKITAFGAGIPLVLAILSVLKLEPINWLVGLITCPQVLLVVLFYKSFSGPISAQAHLQVLLFLILSNTVQYFLLSLGIAYGVTRKKPNIVLLTIAVYIIGWSAYFFWPR